MTRQLFITIMNNEDDTDFTWEGDEALQGLQIVSKYVDKVVCSAGQDVIASADIDD